jgi:hypothetical protein
MFWAMWNKEKMYSFPTFSESHWLPSAFQYRGFQPLIHADKWFNFVRIYSFPASRVSYKPRENIYKDLLDELADGKMMHTNAEVPMYRSLILALEACFSCLFWSMHSLEKMYVFPPYLWPPSSFE